MNEPNTRRQVRKGLLRMQYRFERGLWSLLPQSEWTDRELALHVDMLMAGAGGYLDDELCRLNDDATLQGYRRVRIGRNRYGYALYGNASQERVSQIVGTMEEAIALGRAFEARDPGFHFVDTPKAPLTL